MHLHYIVHGDPNATHDQVLELQKRLNEDLMAFSILARVVVLPHGSVVNRGYE